MGNQGRAAAARDLSSQFIGIRGATVRADVPLKEYTRFGIGGPATFVVDCPDSDTFLQALGASRHSGLPWVVLGNGTNVIVSDHGFDGIVLRLTASGITSDGPGQVRAEAGAWLNDVVDFANALGLRGLETLAGIPGSFGAAIYGNAGAYGHSISERVVEVEAIKDDRIVLMENAACHFAYRESAFKDHKEWIILAATLSLEPAEREALQARSSEIVAVRNAKFPPAMRCAGSIFKNQLWEQLPQDVQNLVPSSVVREGKVPSAWFLEQVGAKGESRGGIRVADYHANLVFNAGDGTAADLTWMINNLKARVRDRFGLELAEEVQYVGF